jgi:hypothetical protein
MKQRKLRYRIRIDLVAAARSDWSGYIDRKTEKSNKFNENSDAKLHHFGD